MMKKLIVSFGLIAVLTGCSLTQSTRVDPTTKDTEVNILGLESLDSKDEQPVDKVETLYDKLTDLTQRLIQTPQAKQGGVLLLDDFRGESSRVIHNSDFSKDLVNLLAINSRFELINPMFIEQGKRALGLTSSINYTKGRAIALARYLKSDFVLYTSIKGDNNPVINMQLMSVDTGEIVWSGSSNTSDMSGDNNVGIIQ